MESPMSTIAEPRPFQPLGDYQPPALPAEETLRRLWSRARETLASSDGDDTPFVDRDHLRTAKDDVLDTIVPPPACGPLERELAAALDADEAGQARGRKLVVLPPCESGDLIADWAGRHGHRIVHPPLRSDLLARDDPKGSPLDGLDPCGDGVLVFPRLEEWALRHRDGLGHLTRLLDWLTGAERPFVIGCNAWAWAYLRMAADAHMILPAPIAGQAFDARALRDWFRELTEEDGTADHVFRLTTTGEDVFALAEDGETLECDYLVTLAARSRGIPWVAWNLWRRSLRLGLDDEGEDVKASKGTVEGEDTLWIAQVADATLPDTTDRMPLLILHALLIHGTLDRQELGAVLPLDERPAVLAALVQAGLVGCEGGRYACVASGYPVIRDALGSAGFPMGVL